MRPTSLLIEALRHVSIASIAATAGVPRRSVQAIVDGHVPSVDRAADICAALGLELRIGPPGAVSPAILEALGLPADATEQDVLAAIEARAAPAPPPSAPDPAAGLAPVTDRTLAEMMASLADAWESADDAGRAGLRVRWEAHWPDLVHRALSLSRVLDYLGWRVVSGAGAAARSHDHRASE